MNLIEKYQRPAPRYTSYPPYPYWNQRPTQKEWLSELHSYKDLRVDLYLHIPYCQSLCTYCGCTRTITRNFDKGMDYTSLLLDEWEMYANELPQLKIDSFHLGGGTPTFLKSEYLHVLLENLSTRFSSEFEGAVEIDPRVTSLHHIRVLKKFGVKRFSLGIQDFDEEVQRVCNRIQPVTLVEEVVRELRSSDVSIGINFDLIYGLPQQTKESIEKTIAAVKKLRPNTIALYGYAHVPWRSRAQKSLEKYNIPQGKEKRDLYEVSKEKLFEAGYREIGLDHFALEEDELHKAYQDNTLKRTFMGYTRKRAPVTLGLGASAISSTKRMYVQNEKEVHSYGEKIRKEVFPLAHGHKLSHRDQICSQIIQAVMCQGRANFSSLLTYLTQEEAGNLYQSLLEMEEDGILKMDIESLIVLERGKPFLRNICLLFDHHFSGEEKAFSQSV